MSLKEQLDEKLKQLPDDDKKRVLDFAARLTGDGEKVSPVLNHEEGEIVTPSGLEGLSVDE